MTNSADPGQLASWHVVFSKRRVKVVSFNITFIYLSLFVLRFYSPVNPMWSCRAWSVYLTTLLLGRLSPPSG